MRKRGIVKEKLSVDSAERRLNGSCPLMPEEASNCVNELLFGTILHSYETCFLCPPEFPILGNLVLLLFVPLNLFGFYCLCPLQISNLHLSLNQ